MVSCCLLWINSVLIIDCTVLMCDGKVRRVYNDNGLSELSPGNINVCNPLLAFGKLLIPKYF